MSNADGFVIKNGVLTEYIGEDTEVYIPEGVTAIGDEAFYDRGDIRSVVVPEGVTSIGEDAFSWCYELVGITIPGSVTDIRWSSFKGCEDLSIRAPKGSYAEAYAEENEISFVAE